MHLQSQEKSEYLRRRMMRFQHPHGFLLLHSTCTESRHVVGRPALERTCWYQSLSVDLTALLLSNERYTGAQKGLYSGGTEFKLGQQV